MWLGEVLCLCNEVNPQPQICLYTSSARLFDNKNSDSVFFDLNGWELHVYYITIIYLILEQPSNNPE